MRPLFASGIFCLAMITACSEHQGPVAIIEGNVAEMEQALVDRSNGGFMGHLAESFTGGKAGAADKTRDDAQKMLAVYFLRYRQVRILITQLDVEIDLYEPALARSTATIALSGGERLIPSSAGLYKVSGQWQNFDGDWKLTRLEWE